MFGSFELGSFTTLFLITNKENKSPMNDHKVAQTQIIIQLWPKFLLTSSRKPLSLSIYISMSQTYFTLLSLSRCYSYLFCLNTRIQCKNHPKCLPSFCQKNHSSSSKTPIFHYCSRFYTARSCLIPFQF